MSANTGVAPTSRTALAVAPKLNAGTITSSPGPIPRAAKQATRAAVPELTARLGRPSTMALNSCSKSKTSSPPVSTPDESAETAAAISASEKEGRAIGITGPLLSARRPLGDTADR